MRNVRRFRRALRSGGFLAIGLLLCGLALAAKPVPPPPPPAGTIFFQYSPGTQGMRGDGSGKTLVSSIDFQTYVPSELVYGIDPVIDRWWLAILEMPGEQYPGTSITRQELFALRPYWENGQSQVESVQVTNLYPDIIPSAGVPRWSNDGMDSFVSFRGVELATQATWLIRADVSGGEIDASAALGIDPLVDPDSMEFVAAAPWPFEANFKYHDWDPSGTRVVYMLNVAEPAETTDLDVFVLDLVTGEETRIYDLEQFAIAPRWSPDGTRIAFDYSGSILLVNPNNDLDTVGGLRQWSTFKQGDSKQSYTSPHWSPDGSQLVYRYLQRKTFSTTYFLARAALTGGPQAILSNDLDSARNKATLDWVSNATGGL